MLRKFIKLHRFSDGMSSETTPYQLERNPKVSVIIPAYNLDRFLPEAIDSVITQSFSDFEILLLDHSTNDVVRQASIPYLEGGEKFDERFQYHRIKADSSLSYARNYGISLAQGEYVFFLMHDDTLKPDSLEVLLERQHQSVAGVYGNIDFLSEGGVIYNTRHSKQFKNSEDSVKALLGEGLIPIWAPTLMIRKEVLEELPFIELFGTVDDIEFMTRLWKSYHLDYLDRSVYNFRCHGSNYSTRERWSSRHGWNMLYDAHVDNNGMRIYLKSKRLLINLLKCAKEQVSNKK